MDSEALAAASAAFVEAANKMGLNANQTAAGLAAVAQRMQSTSGQLGKLAANLESAAVGSRAQGTAARNAGLELSKVIASARASARSQDEFREAANRAANSMIDSVSDPRMKASIRRYADAQMDAADRAETFRNVISLASKPMGALGNVVGSTFAAYQSGSGSIGTASALLQAEFRGIGGLVQSLGEGMLKLGPQVTASSLAFAEAAPEVAGIGLGITGLGFIISSLGDGVKKVADGILPKLQAEIEKNITSFMSLSNSGATFAFGLNELSRIGKESHLTLSQLDEVVKANKKTFAEMGVSVSDGLMRVTNVMSRGSNDLRLKLLNLGYSVTEQAGLIAEVTKDMQQAGKPLPDNAATQQMIATETEKYAQNLRIISGVTGEDAKKKMDEARQVAQNLAFQQKLDGMSVTQKEGAIQAMALMNADEKQAFMELVVNGQAMTQKSALLLSQNQGVANSLNESRQALQEDRLDATEQARIQARYQQQVRQEALRNPTAVAGLAGVGGPAGDVAAQQGRMLQDNIKRSAQSTERVINDVYEQMISPTGSLTNEMSKAVIANQDLNVEIQAVTMRSGVLSTYMEMAADAARTFTGGLDFLLKKIDERRRNGETDEQRQQREAITGPGGVGERLRGRPVVETDQQRQEREAREAHTRELQERANRQQSAADAFQRRFEAERARQLNLPGAPVTSNQQPRQNQRVQPAQPVQPNANANPAGTSVTPSVQATPNARRASANIPGPVVGSPEWTRQQAAAYHTEGLRVVQPNDPNATAMPNGPNANETEQQRQARVAAEAQARLAIDEQDEREARNPTRRSETMQQQRASVPDLLESLGNKMSQVHKALAISLEHLAQIETNTNKTAVNTI